MPKGGARPGAGRKKKSTDAVIAQGRANLIAVASRTNLIPFVDEEIRKLTPLEMMQLAAQVSFQEGDYKTAAMLAKEVAPYCHAKLQTITMKTDNAVEVRELTREELAERIAALAAIENAEYEEVGSTDPSREEDTN